MGCIFISYRRNDSAGYAGRIYDRLVAHFGKRAVFMDIGGIPPGQEFMRVIEEHIGSCSTFLPIIGEDWLSQADAAGLRRLDRADDPVRLEIETAVRSKVRIIPVLVGRASMPSSPDLPWAAEMLGPLNAVTVTHEMFDECMAKLIQAMESSKRPAEIQVPLRLQSIRIFYAIAAAALATIATVFIFNWSPLTADVPLGAGETLFVFLFWLLLSMSMLWLIGKTKRSRRPG